MSEAVLGLCSGAARVLLGRTEKEKEARGAWGREGEGEEEEEEEEGEMMGEMGEAAPGGGKGEDANRGDGEWGYCC